jgi:hypothetical protein
MGPRVGGARVAGSGIRYQVSGIRYQVSGIRYQLSDAAKEGKQRVGDAPEHGADELQDTFWGAKFGMLTDAPVRSGFCARCFMSYARAARRTMPPRRSSAFATSQPPEERT